MLTRASPSTWIRSSCATSSASRAARSCCEAAGATSSKREPGRFRASFPTPDEYHLTFTAAGYHDAEAYTPKVTELKTVGGIVARMKKKTDGSTPTIAPQSISGTVTPRRPAGSIRLGRPVGIEATPERGQLPRSCGNAPSWASRVPTPAPPFTTDLITSTCPSRARPGTSSSRSQATRSRRSGRSRSLSKSRRRSTSPAPKGAASAAGSRTYPPDGKDTFGSSPSARPQSRRKRAVEPSGQFTLPSLPPGEYGLKAGHDAYDDAEVYPGKLAIEHPESFKETADPWKRAKLVTVKPGRDSDVVEVEFPR